MKNSEVEELVNKFYDAKTSREEEKKLFEFFRKNDLPDILKKHKYYFDLMSDLKSKGVSADFDRKLEEKIRKPVISKDLSRFNFKIAATISIVFIASIAAWVFLFRIDSQSLKEVATDKKEQQKLTLSDGTLVWLNYESKIVFPENFSAHKREVFLEGEAFFQVTKDKAHPFYIRTKNTATEVIGTSFNLKTISDESQVQLTVVSGKVAFSSTNSPQSERILLVAGNGARYDKMKNSIHKTEEVDPNILAWKTHRLVFNDVPLKNVAKVLSQYFEVDMQIANNELAECRFKGTFNNAKLKEVFEVMNYSMNIHASKKDNTYILTGKGCKALIP